MGKPTGRDIIREKSLAALRRAPSHTLTHEQISERVRLDPSKVLDGLQDLQKEGKVVRVGKGSNGGAWKLTAASEIEVNHDSQGQVGQPRAYVDGELIGLDGDDELVDLDADPLVERARLTAEECLELAKQILGLDSWSEKRKAELEKVVEEKRVHVGEAMKLLAEAQAGLTRAEEERDGVAVEYQQRREALWAELRRVEQ